MGRWVAAAVAVAFIAIVRSTSYQASRSGAATPACTWVVIVLRTASEDQVAGRATLPDCDADARAYANLTNYDAVASQASPTALHSFPGETQGIANDCTWCSAFGPSIGTLLFGGDTGSGEVTQRIPDWPR